MSLENDWLKYGLMYALFSVFTSLLFYYVMPIGMFTEGMIGFAALIVFMVLAIKSHRSKIGPYEEYPFGSGFSTGFMTGFVGLVISSLFSIILFHLIDPSLIDVLKDRTIESTESFLQKLNAPEENIQEAIEKIENDFSDKFSPVSILISIVTGSAILAFIASIIALVFKRQPKIA